MGKSRFLFAHEKFKVIFDYFGASKYPGYHELAYLHPNHFTPDPEVVRSYGIPVPSSPSQLVPQVPNKSSINSQKEQVPPSSNSQLVPQVTNFSSDSSQREQATPSSNPQLVPQVTNSSSDSSQKEQAKPYFILRFASLNAHHDSGIKGINTEIAQRGKAKRI